MKESAPLGDHDVFELFPNVMINRDNIEHYRALAQGHLLINQCQDCGYWVYPHRPLCPKCWSWRLAPTEVSGAGRVFMFTVVQQPRDPFSTVWEPVVPAAIELVEQPGLRYLARVVECPLESITLDMPVRLTWIQDGARQLPVFKPAEFKQAADHG